MKVAPSARSGHRVVPWKRSAVLFGGFYDNALETRYFDDLWILSDLDAGGKWDLVTFAAHSEIPHKRSGHCMAVHDDFVFIYGGYSTEKLNRFGKTEATVHHDLWMAPLTSTQPAMWTKIKLGGIPPPIRSGVSYCQREKKLYLFGGVVDLDAPGGRAMSSFQNDLFVLQLDTKKFYPVVLNRPKRTAAQGASADSEKEGKSSLAAQLEALNLGQDSDSEEESDSEAVVKPGPNATSTSALQFSHIVLPTTQVLPCGRMNGMLCTAGHMLYLFGGQFEEGKKELTMSDLFALNLNRMETWEPLQPMALADVKGQWKGADDDNESQGSWEDGSTVVDTDEIARLAELDEDGNVSSDEDELARKPKEEMSARDILKKGAVPTGSDEDDSDEAPELAPAAPPAATASTGLKEEEVAQLGLDGRKTVKGKIGRKVHKDQLKAQLGSTAIVPSPTLGESVKEFFRRTREFWMQSALEALGDVGEKTLEKTGFKFCQLRYTEAMTLMEQIEQVEEAQKAEDEWIREHLAQKRKVREEQQREDDSESDEGGAQ